MNINRTEILDELMNYKNFSKKTELAKFLNIKPNVLSNWYSRNTLDEDIIINAFPEINKVWILTGEGNMLLKENNNPEQGSSGNISYNQNIGRPFYNLDWTLGLDKNDFEEYKYPEFNIDFKPANRDSIEWYRGRGQSMLGEIDSGDYIALEEIIDFSWFPLGKIYGIITKNGFRTIKRIIKSDDKENYLLVSNNPDKKSHPDQEIPKNMITRLFKIVYVIKDLDE
ncbi:LexA family transcriptional regulator [Elizabethkingia anophelis]|uniref:LexA family transcriptional regulator n=1 Tax=Elizabethkingia anophelis TaxID=1117645 RepID=UPI003207CCDA